MEGAELEIRPAAMHAIARKALPRIIENLQRKNMMPRDAIRFSLAFKLQLFPSFVLRRRERNAIPEAPTSVG